MTRMIQCAKLGTQAEGLEIPPFPGSQGQQIFDTISKQVWQQWLSVQTMLINEHKLASFEPKARKFIAQERQKYLFGDGIEIPDDYVPPSG